MYDYLRYLWQRYKGCPPHMWWPEKAPRQYIPVSATCLRCSAHRVFLPTGSCLATARDPENPNVIRGTRHPIRDHYDEEGNLVDVPGCPDGPL